MGLRLFDDQQAIIHHTSFIIHSSSFIMGAAPSQARDEEDAELVVEEDTGEQVEHLAGFPRTSKRLILLELRTEAKQPGNLHKKAYVTGARSALSRIDTRVHDESDPIRVAPCLYLTGVAAYLYDTSP